MERGRAGALLIVALLGADACVASADFFEDFGSGWENRWAYSADDKYTGRFVADTPEEWQEAGLKVSSLLSLSPMNLPEPKSHTWLTLIAKASMSNRCLTHS